MKSDLSTFSPARHLLIIQPLVGIGDMIWHKPWIDRLSRDYRVTLMTKPSVQADVIFEGAPSSFSILDIDRSVRGRKGRHDGLAGLIRLARDMRRSGADTALILHHSPRYALAARLAGIKKRLGYGVGRQKTHLNAGHFLNKSEITAHAIDRIGQFAHKNGFGLAQPKWSIQPRATAFDAARRFLMSWAFVTEQRAITPFLCIGVGAMSPERQWGAQNFANLICHLSAQRPEMRCVVISGPHEQILADDITAKLCAAGVTAPVFLGRLDEAVALMTLSCGYVGNDTGLLNLMACVHKPALGLFSHSRPLDYSPYLHKTDALGDDDYGQPGIIQNITPLHVMEKIDLLWPAPLNKPYIFAYR